MSSGRPLRPRPLADIRRDLDAGPEWYGLSAAAGVIGMTATTLNTCAGRGEVQRTRGDNGDYRYHRDELWEFAQVAHGLHPGDLRTNGAAHAAVAGMMARWQDCETVQQLHDAGHVHALPPVRDDHGRRPPAEHEIVVCSRCGGAYQRPVDSAARYSMCAPCTSSVIQRAAWLVREFVRRRDMRQP